MLPLFFLGGFKDPWIISLTNTWKGSRADQREIDSKDLDNYAAPEVNMDLLRSTLPF